MRRDDQLSVARKVLRRLWPTSYYTQQQRHIGSSPKAKKTLKRSQKDSVVADKIKKPKVVPNVTLRRSLRNKK
ncbi:hypothetical protein M0804_011514 [Polistes exclamans]|nr:hypothetical protein M0804_011514 [Polistes exclamans]